MGMLLCEGRGMGAGEQQAGGGLAARRARGADPFQRRGHPALHRLLHLTCLHRGDYTSSYLALVLKEAAEIPTCLNHRTVHDALPQDYSLGKAWHGLASCLGSSPGRAFPETFCGCLGACLRHAADAGVGCMGTDPDAAAARALLPPVLPVRAGPAVAHVGRRVSRERAARLRDLPSRDIQDRQLPGGCPILCQFWTTRPTVSPCIPSVQWHSLQI